MATATAVKLTPAQHRVQLAEDVLRQIATKRFVAEHNTYVTSVDGTWEEAHETTAGNYTFWHNPEYSGGALQDDDCFQVELLPPKQCKVCVDGALFVAALDRHDDLKLRDLESPHEVGGEDMNNYLTRWFTTFQTRLMELAFEGCWHGTHDPEGTKGFAAGADGDMLFRAAENFYEFYTSDCVNDDGLEGLNAEQLMVEIMKNVISNRGTFRPDKDADVQKWSRDE